MSKISLIKLINLGPATNRYGLISGRPLIITAATPIVGTCNNSNNINCGVGSIITSTRSNSSFTNGSSSNDVITKVGTNEGISANASTNAGTNPNSNNNKANTEQLIIMEQKLVADLPGFFIKPHNLNIYTQDLVFIDNIRNVKTNGLAQYALLITLVRFYHAMRYSSNNLELLNLVRNQEESYIRIRWRVTSKPSMFQMTLFFWRFKSAKIWKDGISTMHLNKEGKVYCHVCDNIDVQTDDICAKRGQPLKNPLVSRGLDV